MIEVDDTEKDRSREIATGRSLEEEELLEIEIGIEVVIEIEIEADQEIAQVEIGQKFADRIRETVRGAMFAVLEVTCAVPVLI